MSSPKCFDKNKEAVNLLENIKGSIENKVRTSFNLGYWQGWRDGQREAVQLLERTLMDMTEREDE